MGIDINFHEDKLKAKGIFSRLYTTEYELLISIEVYSERVNFKNID